MDTSITRRRCTCDVGGRTCLFFVIINSNLTHNPYVLFSKPVNTGRSPMSTKPHGSSSMMAKSIPARMVARMPKNAQLSSRRRPQKRRRRKRRRLQRRRTARKSHLPNRRHQRPGIVRLHGSKRRNSVSWKNVDERGRASAKGSWPAKLRSKRGAEVRSPRKPEVNKRMTTVSVVTTSAAGPQPLSRIMLPTWPKKTKNTRALRCHLP